MGYSHSTGAWYFLLVPLALVAVRMIAGQRRRSMGPGRRGTGPRSASALTDAPGGAPPPGIRGQAGIPAGWLVDPSGRYEQRYWSGTEWTEHVTKDGVPGTDPPPGTDASTGR